VREAAVRDRPRARADPLGLHRRAEAEARAGTAEFDKAFNDAPGWVADEINSRNTDKSVASWALAVLKDLPVSRRLDSPPRSRQPRPLRRRAVGALPGRPLDAAARAELEALPATTSGVRVHTDDAAPPRHAP
jgi:hypothetical protein